MIRGEDSLVDRISILPHEVLWLIMSHLTFKEQIAFSILSRRLGHSLASTTSLDFDGITTASLERRWREKGASLGKEKLNYVSWVNRVVASCQSPTIEFFRLCFNLGQNDGGYIDEWLRYALAKKVKTLVLNFTDYLADRSFGVDYKRFKSGVDECYVFPYRSLHIDEEIHFNQLEKLSLDYVSVDCEALKFFLHNCPLLEDLSVSNSSKLSIVSVVEPFPSLKRLVVRTCCNLELLEIRDADLVYLRYDGSYVPVRLHNVPKLVNLSVPLGIFRAMYESIVQFASILDRLEALYLELCYEFSFPVKMNNLKQLEVTFYSLRRSESHQWLADLIQSIPCLQKIVFKVGAFPRQFRERELKKMGITRSYPELKEVEFVGFRGAPSDLEFVLHLVDNAVGLKRVVIDPRRVVLDPRRVSRNRGAVDVHCYTQKEITALDRAEKQLALEVPGNIELDFRRRPNYPLPLRERALGL